MKAHNFHYFLSDISAPIRANRSSSLLCLVAVEKLSVEKRFNSRRTNHVDFQVWSRKRCSLIHLPFDILLFKEKSDRRDVNRLLITSTAMAYDSPSPFVVVWLLLEAKKEIGLRGARFPNRRRVTIAVLLLY